VDSRKVGRDTRFRGRRSRWYGLQLNRRLEEVDQKIGRERNATIIDRIFGHEYGGVHERVVGTDGLGAVGANGYSSLVSRRESERDGSAKKTRIRIKGPRT